MDFQINEGHRILSRQGHACKDGHLALCKKMNWMSAMSISV